MGSQADTNPQLPLYVRLISIAVILFLLYGALHLFWPAIPRPRWPWEIPPFNSRFLGAIYAAEAITVAQLVWINRWSPGRLGLLLGTIFTTIATLGTIIHAGQFKGGPTTWLWFFLYGAYVLLPLAVLLRFWKTPLPPPAIADMRVKAILRLLGLALAAYGLALFVVPESATAFWPWPVDGLHARIYSGVFAAIAAALLLLAWNGAAEERLMTGLGLLSWGGFSILGLLLAMAETGRNVLANAGAWVWLLLMAGLAGLGIALLRQPAARAGA